MRSITLLNIQPTLVEVKTAIKLMKNGKSAGIDGVMAEALKAGGEIVIQRLHSMLQLVWHSEKKIPLCGSVQLLPQLGKKATVVSVRITAASAYFQLLERSSCVLCNYDYRTIVNRSQEKSRLIFAHKEVAAIKSLTSDS